MVTKTIVIVLVSISLIGLLLATSFSCKPFPVMETPTSWSYETDGHVRCVSLSADGSTIATGSDARGQPRPRNRC